MNWWRCVLSMHSLRGRLRTGASEDQCMVAPWCDEWLTTWCGLTLGRVLQVHVAAWFALVQVKNGRERSMPVWPLWSGETSRLNSMDPVVKENKCGPHRGKKSKTKLWTWAGAG
jgi:hypothetical protein